MIQDALVGLGAIAVAVVVWNFEAAVAMKMKSEGKSPFNDPLYRYKAFFFQIAFFGALGIAAGCFVDFLTRM